MEKGWVFGIIIGIVIGVIIGAFIFQSNSTSNSNLQSCYTSLDKYETANSMDKMTSSRD